MAGVEAAVMDNDRRAALVAVRNSLATAIDECESGRDMAALTKRLMEVMAEIDAIDSVRAKKSGKLAGMQSRASRRHG